MVCGAVGGALCRPFNGRVVVGVGDDVVVGGFRFAVRVKAGARRTVVGGRWDGRLGVALVVAVVAPAVNGRANEAVCAVLAECLGVRRRDVAVVVGATSRDKIIAVTSGEVAATVAALIGTAATNQEE